MGFKVALVVLIALAAAAAAPASPPRHAKVLVRSMALGNVLVDARGHTLYLFEADRGTKSACYGQCAAAWPPFLTSGAPVTGAGVKKSLLSTAKRKDGTLQVVYAGHPLYFFGADTRAGQAKGEGIDHFGGVWYAVNASGEKVGKPSPPATTTDGGGGYGGYGP